jgi:transposase
VYYVGIDIAKRNHEASLIDADGRLLSDSISFSNSKEGCDKLLAMFEKSGVNSRNVVVGMEATGHYWLSLYSCLLELGYDLKVINPIQSDAFRKMSIRKTKNDSKDSLNIAQIMRFGEYSSTRLSEENVQAMKQLSRYRFSVVEECGGCKCKIIALLDQVFPEYEQLFSDTFGKASKELLLNCQTPEDMLAISSKDLASLLTKASKGRFKQEKAEQIKKAASGSFGVRFAKDAFSFQLKQLIGQINFLEKQLGELDKEIAKLLAQTNTVITTLPGVGAVLGAAIISEIGDIGRFGAPGKLVAFAGLDASVSQSGEFSGTRGKLSKRGSPHLRRAIWMAASRACFCDEILSAYYQSLRARGKHHLTAVSAAARKMCNIIFALLKENRPYQATPPKKKPVSAVTK